MYVLLENMIKILVRIDFRRVRRCEKYTYLVTVFL